MFFFKFRQWFFKSRFGKVIGGAYIIYLITIIISSAQIGLQLGAELRNVPEDHRMEYITTFLSNKF